MMTKDDGGAAFPMPAGADVFRQHDASPGMSLRDWFAGQALVSVAEEFLLNPEALEFSKEAGLAAKAAYAFADAMLAERSKP